MTGLPKGRFESAKQNFKESLSVTEISEGYLRNAPVLILSSWLFADRSPGVAAKILSCLDAHKEKGTNKSAFPLIMRDFDKILVQTRLHLDESVFRAAWAEGEKMTIEGALDLALKTLDEI